MKFSTQLTGQTAGTALKLACKFAYAGGMSVTNVFTYLVGENCTSTAVENPMASTNFFYPNPVHDVLHLNLTDEPNHIVITDLMGRKIFDKVVSSSYKLNISDLNPDIYLIQVENKQGLMNGKVIKK